MNCEASTKRQRSQSPNSSPSSFPTHDISGHHSEHAWREQGNKETSQVQHECCEAHADENEEIVIKSVRGTDLARGLRRIPAGFYVIVCHGNLEWRTENKPVSVNNDVLEWRGPIPIPSDPTAHVSVAIHASFEFQPMLGNGEQLQRMTIPVNELLDRSVKNLPFLFAPKDEDVVSPCSSLLVTVQWRKRGSIDAGTSTDILEPHHSSTGSSCQLEDATDNGHSALSLYRRRGTRQDLQRAIEKFEHALDICPSDHPCRAAAQSNMAMATLVGCWVNPSASLDVPLMLCRYALAARPVGHLDRPSTLIQLATVHLAQLQQRGDHDIAEVGALLHEVIALCSAESHERRAAKLMLQQAEVRARGQPTLEQDLIQASQVTDMDPLDFATALLRRFERFGDLPSLQQAITVLEASVGSISPWSHRYLVQINHLGVALIYRFNRLGELNDLEKGISRLRDAVHLTPDGHLNKPAGLNNLGKSLRSRFRRLGELGDLEEAISRLRDAVRLTPDGHPLRCMCLDNLGCSFRARFEYLGALSDLNAAVSMQRDAVYLTADGYPSKPEFLSNLGESLEIRFLHLGELGDLEEAISRQRDAVRLAPDGHLNKSGYLNDLGNSLATRFEHLGESGDLEEAISRHWDAVRLTPDGDSEKPGFLNNLGGSFSARFGHLGDLSDLEEAISRELDAVRLAPDSNPRKCVYLNNLGASFATRFEHLGDLSDVEEAISRQRDAVRLTPGGHPDKPRHLNNLSCSFATRFECLGELSDLEEAISRQRDAVCLAPDGYPDKPLYMNNLGNFFKDRFECLGGLSDLEEAISRQQDAVRLTMDGHPDKPGYLNNLSISFFTRFRCLGDLGDIENAISIQRDAVRLTPDRQPDRPRYLGNLGNSLLSRFEYLGELNDLEEAIARQKDAVRLTTDGHPQKPARLNNLGDCFSIRFRHFGELSDLQQVLLLSARAACISGGPVAVQFLASQHWILSARRLHHHSLLHAYSVAISLLPQLAWSGFSLSRRFRELIQGDGIVRQAAAAALDAGQPETAVEWLEQGRSIVWGGLFQLRNSYDELASVHSDHARRLRGLSAVLEHTSIASEKLSLPSEQTASAERRQSLQQENERHRKLAIERDKLLQEIRQLPGFERFLLHKEFSRLRASAHSGPVVFLNATETRCDALIVLAEVDRVIHVPLPNFTLQRSTELQTDLDKFVRQVRGESCDGSDTGRYLNPVSRDVGMWKVLSPLWKCVVKPVLDALALSVCDAPWLWLDFDLRKQIPASGEFLPRIFWCPTGPFTFLPIHAAGIYDTSNWFSQPGHKVFDFVVSSYTPTLSILASSHSETPTSSDLRLLAVRQPDSDGLPKLPGTGRELEHINAMIENFPSARVTLKTSSDGKVEEVLSLMKETDWVHFACHGVQDSMNPTNSGLCLANMRRLRISDIIALSRPRGGLAFLSACQTAKGDEDLSDEAIHIAAGMLFAGYGGVIGTMWSISDSLAPELAKDIYKRLFRNGTRPDYRDAARALHDAVARVRQDKNVSFKNWLPFIHVGL